MPDRLRDGWPGLLLSLIAAVSVLWLGSRGGLELYVHPRYVEFEIVMALIAGALALAAVIAAPARRGTARPHDHDHDLDSAHAHDHGAPPTRGERLRAAIGGAIAVAVLLGALLVLPPATLTSTTAQQRDLNSGIPLSVDVTFASGDDASLTIKDWAALLRVHDAEFFAAREPVLEGMVIPDPDRPEVFYVSRFVVTCCAVDARPVGVPVRLPGWQEQYPVDSWVRVEGGFSPVDGGPEPVIVDPVLIEAIEQPDAPYLG